MREAVGLVQAGGRGLLTKTRFTICKINHFLKEIKFGQHFGGN